MNGWELLSEVASGEATDADAAAEFLRRAGVRAATAATLLHPIVEHAVATHRRNSTRITEQSVFRNGGSARRLLGEVVDSMDDRKRLFESSFALPDGRMVTWGDASEADHEARIAMLGKLRAGLDATISRHEQALALIREHGGGCLNDIPDAA